MLTEAAEPRQVPSPLFLMLLAGAFRQDERFWNTSLEVWVFLRAPILPRALGLMPFSFFSFFVFSLNSGKISDISLVHVCQEGGRETVIAPHSAGSELRKLQPRSVQPHHEGSMLHGNLIILRWFPKPWGPCPGDRKSVV